MKRFSKLREDRLIIQKVLQAAMMLKKQDNPMFEITPPPPPLLPLVCACDTFSVGM